MAGDDHLAPGGAGLLDLRLERHDDRRLGHVGTRGRVVLAASACRRRRRRATTACRGGSGARSCRGRRRRPGTAVARQHRHVDDLLVRRRSWLMYVCSIQDALEAPDAELIPVVVAGNEDGARAGDAHRLHLRLQEPLGIAAALVEVQQHLRRARPRWRSPRGPSDRACRSRRRCRRGTRRSSARAATRTRCSRRSRAGSSSGSASPASPIRSSR